MTQHSCCGPSCVVRRNGADDAGSIATMSIPSHAGSRCHARDTECIEPDGWSPTNDILTRMSRLAPRVQSHLTRLLPHNPVQRDMRDIYSMGDSAITAVL